MNKPTFNTIANNLSFPFMIVPPGFILFLAEVFPCLV
jgi:hypothetical protein